MTLQSSRGLGNKIVFAILIGTEGFEDRYACGCLLQSLCQGSRFDCAEISHVTMLIESV